MRDIERPETPATVRHVSTFHLQYVPLLTKKYHASSNQESHILSVGTWPL